MRKLALFLALLLVPLCARAEEGITYPFEVSGYATVWRGDGAVYRTPDAEEPFEYLHNGASVEVLGVAEGGMARVALEDGSVAYVELNRLLFAKGETRHMDRDSWCVKRAGSMGVGDKAAGRALLGQGTEVYVVGMYANLYLVRVVDDPLVIGYVDAYYCRPLEEPLSDPEPEGYGASTVCYAGLYPEPDGGTEPIIYVPVGDNVSVRSIEEQNGFVPVIYYDWGSGVYEGYIFADVLTICQY